MPMGVTRLPSHPFDKDCDTDNQIHGLRQRYVSEYRRERE